MDQVFLINYSVKGIKSLDKLITLSFYKKTISKDMNTQEYNVKGIYGMNGSGKSGIVTSVNILKNILINPSYLGNPAVQENLDALINKELKELSIFADFVVNICNVLMYFKYEVVLSLNETGKYKIASECLSSKKANSPHAEIKKIFTVRNGIVAFNSEEGDESYFDTIKMKTMNLLESASMCSLFFEKIFFKEKDERNNWDLEIVRGLSALFVFGYKINVFLDQSDNHRPYVLEKMENKDDYIKSFLNNFSVTNTEYLHVISSANNYVSKDNYENFCTIVEHLYAFLRIFKSDLKGIEIDRKENQNFYVCDLIMVYDSYRIHAEFESTGIKKLITLYTYIREMVQGGIVFIDEFDSNLHDVYLCALLEYLMTYAQGQLCFTTHNVGPMDVLKHHKKSIDFLSADGKIYSWITNGNYSPSKLYRNGMIEGSPFNVDSIDFIGIFN